MNGRTREHPSSAGGGSSVRLGPRADHAPARHPAGARCAAHGRGALRPRTPGAERALAEDRSYCRRRPRGCALASFADDERQCRAGDRRSSEARRIALASRARGRPPHRGSGPHRRLRRRDFGGRRCGRSRTARGRPGFRRCSAALPRRNRSGPESRVGSCPARDCGADRRNLPRARRGGIPAGDRGCAPGGRYRRRAAFLAARRRDLRAMCRARGRRCRGAAAGPILHFRPSGRAARSGSRRNRKKTRSLP